MIKLHKIGSVSNYSGKKLQVVERPGLELSEECKIHTGRLDCVLAATPSLSLRSRSFISRLYPLSRRFNVGIHNIVIRVMRFKPCLSLG